MFQRIRLLGRYQSDSDCIISSQTFSVKSLSKELDLSKLLMVFCLRIWCRLYHHKLESFAG